MIERCQRRRVGIVVSTAAAIIIAVLSIHQSSALITVPTSNIHRTSKVVQRRPLLPLTTSSTLVRSKLPTRSSIKNPLICYYADEWIDADIDLAFHNSAASSCSTTPTKSPKQKSASSLLRKLLRMFSKRTWYQLKENIRTRIERSTVYVLECQDGKYYVGSTTNRKRRLQEHARHRGSKWTRAYKPLRVLKEYRRIPSKFLLGMESKITAECMLEFGVNNVRGSMFCSPKDYHSGDIDALTKFLGHYNDLNYRKVNLRLMKTLPISPKQLRKKNNYNNHMSGRCFACKKHGHFAATCPERHAMSLAP